MVRILSLVVLLLLCLPRAQAAVTIDIDCDRLRQSPEAMALITRLRGDLPATAQAKIAIMQSLLGWDPAKDLHRVVIDVPEQGAPTVRLIGLPAQKIADFLSLHGTAVSLPGGLSGHPLPQRPQALFVALDADQALIGRGDLLAALPALPAAPDAPNAAITVHAVPRADSEPTLLALVASVTATGDGNGNLIATITAHDEAAAVEFARRVGVIRDMVAVGAKGGLPRVVEAQQILDHTTLTREGAVLHLAIALPADLHQQLFDRLAERIEHHIGHGHGATAAAVTP